MRPPYSVLAQRMGPGGAGAPRGARDVTNPNPIALHMRISLPRGLYACDSLSLRVAGILAIN